MKKKLTDLTQFDWISIAIAPVSVLMGAASTTGFWTATTWFSTAITMLFSTLKKIEEKGHEQPVKPDAK